MLSVTARVPVVRQRGIFIHPKEVSYLAYLSGDNARRTPLGID